MSVNSWMLRVFLITLGTIDIGHRLQGELQVGSTWEEKNKSGHEGECVKTDRC